MFLRRRPPAIKAREKATPACGALSAKLCRGKRHADNTISNNLQKECCVDQ